jgi:hypothetical protein
MGEVQKRLVALGATAQPMTPQQFSAFLLDEDAKTAAFVKQG